MAARSIERASWFAAAAALVALSLAHASFGYSHSDTAGHAIGSDDAFITFRYAENLLRGDGLVFNPGGPRVEGFTNLGYLLLCLPGLALFGRDGVLAWAIAINLLAALAAAGLAAWSVRASWPERYRPLLPWLFVLQPVLWISVGAGLETPFVVLFQVGLWIAITGALGAPRSDTRTALLLALVAIGAVLIRADGFVPIGIAVVYLVLRRRLGLAGWLAGCGAITFLALLAFRVAYYDDVLPNTYYAKVSAPPWLRVPAGIQQLAIVATQQGLAPELVSFGAAWVAARRLRSWPRFEIFFATGLVGYWLWIGGDVFQERHLVGLYLLGTAFVARWFGEQDAASTTGSAVARWRGIALGALVVVHLVPVVFDLRFRYTTAHTDRWVNLGRYLAEHESPDTVIAVDAAGKIPFFSGLTAIDMLGLNDRELAHRERRIFRVGHDAYDADYLLSRRPDRIACWIEPDLDMFYGLDHDRWQRAGYALRYLVFADENFYGETVVLDARELSSDVVPSLIRAGFRYGVLALEGTER